MYIIPLISRSVYTWTTQISGVYGVIPFVLVDRISPHMQCNTHNRSLRPRSVCDAPTQIVVDYFKIITKSTVFLWLLLANSMVAISWEWRCMFSKQWSKGWKCIFALYASPFMCSQAAPSCTTKYWELLSCWVDGLDYSWSLSYPCKT